MIKKPEDFEVPHCVGHHYYAPEKKRWRWHCLTCDTGSGKRPVHRRGHHEEWQAAYGFQTHANAMRIQRQQELYRAWWWQTIMTTEDVEVFRQLWLAHHGHSLDGELVGRIMATVQADERLREAYLGIAE